MSKVWNRIYFNMSGSRKFRQGVLNFFGHPSISQSAIWTSLKKKFDPKLLEGVHTSISKETYSNLWFSSRVRTPCPPFDLPLFGSNHWTNQNQISNLTPWVTSQHSYSDVKMQTHASCLSHLNKKLWSIITCLNCDNRKKYTRKNSSV